MSSTAPDDDRAKYEAFKELVSNIRRDEQEGLVLPLSYDEGGKKEYELELLTTGGTRQFDTDKIIGRYDQRISMTVLADFIMLGHEQVGTQAVGQTKSKLFTAALGAWLDSICAIVNEMAIPRLLALNGIVTDTPPQLQHGEIDDMDLEAVGAFLANLSAAGAQLDLAPGSPLSNTLLRGAGLPEISPEEAAKLKAEQQAEADRAAQQTAQNTPAPAPAQQSAPAKTAPTPARPRAPTRGKKAP